MKKKYVLIFLTVCLMMFSGCIFFNSKKEKTFTCDNFAITLDSSFSEVDQIGTNLTLISNNYVVALSLNTNNTTITLNDFCNIIKSQMPVEMNFLDETTNGEVQFKYALYDNKGSDNVNYSYLSSVFKKDGVFYIVDMACKSSKKTDKIMAQFLTWTKSVEFLNSETE